MQGLNWAKDLTCALVVHAVREPLIKRIFGYSKVRYRGLAKNAERLHVLAGFTNLLKSKDYLLA